MVVMTIIFQDLFQMRHLWLVLNPIVSHFSIGFSSETQSQTVALSRTIRVDPATQDQLALIVL